MVARLKSGRGLTGCGLTVVSRDDCSLGQTRKFKWRLDHAGRSLVRFRGSYLGMPGPELIPVAIMQLEGGGFLLIYTSLPTNSLIGMHRELYLVQIPPALLRS